MTIEQATPRRHKFNVIPPERLEFVRERLARGSTGNAIRQALMKPPPDGYGLSRRQSLHYIQIVRERIAATAPTDPRYTFAFVYDQSLALLAACKARKRAVVVGGRVQMVEDPDLRTMSGVLKNLWEMSGGVQNISVTGTVAVLSYDELQRRIVAQTANVTRGDDGVGRILDARPMGALGSGDTGDGQQPDREPA